MTYPLEARCPCCGAALDAVVTVRCEGHDTHEIELELAPAEPVPQAGAEARPQPEEPW